MPYEVVFSRRFSKRLSKLAGRNEAIKKKVQKKIRLLYDNPNYESLRLHKLSGRDNWSLSVTDSLRMIFSIRGNLILFTDIGSHDDVY